MKKAYYSFIHKLLHISLANSLESRRFFRFFISASIIELTLSKLLPALSKIGIFDFYTAAKLAPMMTEAAVLSLILTPIAAIILDRFLRDS